VISKFPVSESEILAVFHGFNGLPYSRKMASQKIPSQECPFSMSLGNQAIVVDVIRFTACLTSQHSTPQSTSFEFIAAFY
jgi:hypothetical protein